MQQSKETKLRVPWLESTFILSVATGCGGGGSGALHPLHQRPLTLHLKQQLMLL